MRVRATAAENGRCLSQAPSVQDGQIDGFEEQIEMAHQRSAPGYDHALDAQSCPDRPVDTQTPSSVMDFPFRSLSDR